MFRSNGLFQAYADIKALKAVLWEPGHSVHVSGGHFSFHHSQSATCLYVCVHVEPAQKKESLNVGVGLLILDGEFITAFNVRKQKQKTKKKTWLRLQFQI